MKYQKLSEINYLRTFEATDAIKFYSPFLWTKNYKALGSVTLGVLLGVFGVMRTVASTDLRIFDYVKNMSVIKALKMTPEGVKALSTVVPACVGSIAVLAALV